MAEYDICMVADRKYMQHILEVAFNIAVMHMNDHVNLHVITESAIQFKDSKHIFGLPQVSVFFHSAKEIEDIVAWLQLDESELRQTTMAYAKLLAFKIMPKKKFLYIDTDCLFARANVLPEIFAVDISEHGLAAVNDFAVQEFDKGELKDCSVDEYFNSGVFLADMSHPKMKNFFEKCVAALKARKSAFRYPDQTIMNIAAAGDFTKLDYKFNALLQQLPNPKFIDAIKPEYNSLQELYDAVKILHFAGYSCPWKADSISAAWVKAHPEIWNYISFYKNNKLSMLEWMAKNGLLPKYQEIVNL